MDSIVHHILDLSKKEKELGNLKKTLEGRIEAMQKYGNQLNGALSALDTKQNTLGYIYILFVKSTFPQVDNQYVNQVENLMSSFDPKQARHCGNRFGAVVHRYTEVIRDYGQSTRGLSFIYNAIDKFRPDPETLTPLHSDYVQLCLKSKNYQAALPLLEQKVFDVNPKKTGTTPREYLLYYYYSGMIHIGLKSFDKAFYFLETAITIPANSLSAIMVEAYKKYLLVGLLLTGKSPSLPKHASSVVQRQIKLYTSEYVDFANAYGSRATEKVMQLASQHTELYQKDHNLGLIKQCIQALYRLNIQRLTQTYLTLSLQDIATTAGLENAKVAEINVLRMIERGEIFATINQKAGMVSFHEDAQSFSSLSTANVLDDRIQKSVGLSQKLKSIDEDIASSTEYLARINGADRFLHDNDMFGDMGGDRPSRGKLTRVFDFLRG